MSQIDTSSMFSIEDLDLEDTIENHQIRDLEKEVESYLSSYSWFVRVNKFLFAAGFSKIAVFYIEIESINYDKELWIIAGDLPIAHLVVDDLPNAKEALIEYVHIMRNWIDELRRGGDLKEQFPIKVDPTLENAIDLERRLDFIEKRFIPEEF